MDRVGVPGGAVASGNSLPPLWRESPVGLSHKLLDANLPRSRTSLVASALSGHLSAILIWKGWVPPFVKAAGVSFFPR